MLSVVAGGLVCIHLPLLHLLGPLRTAICAARHLLRRQLRAMLPAGRVILRGLRQLVTILTCIDIVEGARAMRLPCRALYARLVGHLRVLSGLRLRIVKSLVGCAVINAMVPIRLQWARTQLACAAHVVDLLGRASLLSLLRPAIHGLTAVVHVYHQLFFLILIRTYSVTSRLSGNQQI